MTTRAKAGVHKPKVYMAAKEPLIVEDALQKSNWKATMCDKFLALLRNNTWTLVELPPNRKAIGYKWVFKLK